MGGPGMAPHAPPSVSRSSLGLDRSGSQPATAADCDSVDLRLDRSGNHPAAAARDLVDPGPDRSGSQPVTATGPPAVASGPDWSGSQPVASGPPVPPTNHDVVVVTEMPSGVREADLAERVRDTLVLTAEERRWGRRRVTTTGGRTLALALPTGTLLIPGAILHVGSDWFVVVECAAEPCLAVMPASHEEALRVAFEVGNRHFTLALDGERLLVPDDPGMDIMLTRLGIRYERVRAVFVPIGRGHRHDR